MLKVFEREIKKEGQELAREGSRARDSSKERAGKPLEPGPESGYTGRT
jgi:hypothetical protein